MAAGAGQENDFDRFGPYVDGLVELLYQQGSAESAASIELALDGGVAAEFRASVSLEARRSSGAFFTGRSMADALVADLDISIDQRPIVDPACGPGDLLLAVARSLPTTGNAVETLRSWGERLIGRDLDRQLVRAAQLRLALLAAERTGQKFDLDEAAIARALPGLEVGDGKALNFEEPVFLVLNPPFGQIVGETSWASGRMSRAAAFAASSFDTVPEGSEVRAILPDVLRSGSHSAKWRNHVASLLDEARVEVWGKFDDWTDVDVFILRARRGSGSSIEWWASSAETSLISEWFIVKVGTVVPHRDPKEGPESPYIRAKDLPQQGECFAGGKSLRHAGPRFKAPFVAIRRTSRPSDEGARINATVVRSSKPVLVENHLIVCRPKDGRLETCRRLAQELRGPETAEILDQRIRCRHLTVSSVKDLPFAPS
jgi:N-6 DNA Methylase